MTIRNLDNLFNPHSVALIGATERHGSVGAAVTRNTLSGAFAGRIHLVNRKGGTLAGRPVHRAVAELPEAPDLAVIMTPPDTVASLVDQLARRGTRAAVVVTAGFGEGGDGDGKRRRQALLDAARPHLMRLIGPNCVGFMAPRWGLNASFVPTAPPQGKLAAVAQSGAVLAALADWGADHGIGFSYLASMGDMADVDFGDMLDWLARDHDTRGILLYVEAITQARKFMSAARAVSRLKPVIVLKAGRHAEGARAAASHTGAMAGSDAVYDAAFRRAGLVRVFGLGELFDAAETLGFDVKPRNDTLAIVTNGGGIGVIATDLLLDLGGRLAELAPKTVQALDMVLPATWSRANPVDIIGDADGRRYAAAMMAMADDPNAGAILTIDVPTALASPDEAARAVVAAQAIKPAPVLACWIGGASSEPGRQILRSAGIPTYDTPLAAVRGFMHLVEHRRGQETLMQTPPSLPEDSPPEIAAARGIVAAALSEGRRLLTEPESKRLLAAYDIPVVPTEIARSPAAAAAVAGRIGFPVALKILSRDITHKSDVGGVALNLETAVAVQHAAELMEARLVAANPAARHDGYVVQPMIRRPGAYELILGAAEDVLFGPILMFGHGGTAAETIADKALALPPLNLALADAAMRRTRIDRLLRGFRDRPPAARGEIARTLVRLSRLVADLEEVAELDINPLLADDKGVIALDARVVLRRAVGGERAARFAIRPYPSELEKRIEHGGETLLLRPIRPEDEPALRETVKRLSPEDIRFRFFGPLRELSHEAAARLTQIDYDREMAFVLVKPGAEGAAAAPIGVVRLAAEPGFQAAEFAIVVVSDRQRRGLGSLLMREIVDYARRRGIARLYGDVLPDNVRMLDLVRRLGFAPEPLAAGEKIVRVALRL